MTKIWITIQIGTLYVKAMYKQNYQYNSSSVAMKSLNFHKFNLDLYLYYLYIV